MNHTDTTTQETTTETPTATCADDLTVNSTLEEILAYKKVVMDRMVADGHSRESVEALALNLKVGYMTRLRNGL